MDVEAHDEQKENTHKTVNKMYRFLKFIIPPVKSVSFINLNGSGT